jgi:hypothetical protein
MYPNKQQANLQKKAWIAVKIDLLRGVSEVGKKGPC